MLLHDGRLHVGQLPGLHLLGGLLPAHLGYPDPEHDRKEHEEEQAEDDGYTEEPCEQTDDNAQEGRHESTDLEGNLPTSLNLRQLLWVRYQLVHPLPSLRELPKAPEFMDPPILGQELVLVSRRRRWGLAVRIPAQSLLAFIVDLVLSRVTTFDFINTVL